MLIAQKSNKIFRASERNQFMQLIEMINTLKTCRKGYIVLHYDISILWETTYILIKMLELTFIELI